MPLYDYRCTSCEHTEVKKHSIADLDNVTFNCPSCGAALSRYFASNNSLAFMTPEALGRRKAPGDFRNFMTAIKKAHDKPRNPCGIRDH